MAIVQSLRDNGPEIGGGIAGVGGTVALREFADVSMGPLLGEPGTAVARVTTPSVAYGLGTGALAGVGWWLTGRGSLNDFLLAHAITGIPSGAVSAFLPKSGGGGTTAGAGTRTRRTGTATARSRADGGQDLGGLGDLDDM